MCCNSIRMVMVIYNRVLKSTGRCFKQFNRIKLSGIATGFYSSASNTRPLSDYSQTYELADHTQHEFPSNMRY